MRLRKPSPSMAVAMTALTISLGGTSYAAVKITSGDVKNNTLQGKDIKKGTITSSDVKDNTLQSRDIGKSGVGASEVRNGSLSGADFKAGTLTKGGTGATGPTGPTGPKGDQGPAGVGRWALVNDAGVIEAQSGGFNVTDAYVTNNNIYIDANEDLTDNGIVATIALSNTGTTNFAGEISASRCQITGIVACAPVVAQNTENLVVSPRNSDGTATAAGARKRFYVVVTGDSSDRTTP